MADIREVNPLRPVSPISRVKPAGKRPGSGKPPVKERLRRKKSDQGRKKPHIDDYA